MKLFYNPSGTVKVLPVSVLPVNAVWNGGFPYTPEGSLLVSIVSAKPTDTVSNGGFIQELWGGVCAGYDTPSIWIGGLAITSYGALCLDVDGGIVTDGPVLYNSLTHTAVPARGSIVPSFTRATTATGQKWDEAGYLDFTALAGEAVFKGARREYNQWTTSSVSLASGANKSLTLAAGTYQFSMGAGTGTATFSGTGGATGTLGASASGRVSVAKTITAGTFVVTASVADLADLQVCDLTGETDQTTIRPYVSVGVESAPAYHGSMVDGVKCYDTDRSGNPISTSGSYPLVGYVPWEARTNLCLQSNSFNTAPWTDNSGAATVTQNAIGPDGATSAWTMTDDQVGNPEGRYQSQTLTAATYTYSLFVKKETGTPTNYPILAAFAPTGQTAIITIDTVNGVANAWTAYTARTIATGLVGRCYSYNSAFWRVEMSFTGTAADWGITILPAGSAVSTALNTMVDGIVQGSAVFYGAQVKLGSFATPYIPTTTVAVARNADVDQYPTTAGPIAAAGSIALDFTPYHAPSGTIALWGTYVDASNYTAILHDATNLIFRKRIAGSNYDATIANAFVSGTTYKVAATWGAAGTAIYLDGVAGTPHANTTAAQIAATMQVGADGNSLQQPGAGTTNLRIWQRQLSAPEGVAVTS